VTPGTSAEAGLLGAGCAIHSGSSAALPTRACLPGSPACAAGRPGVPAVLQNRGRAEQGAGVTLLWSCRGCSGTVLAGVLPGVEMCPPLRAARCHGSVAESPFPGRAGLTHGRAGTNSEEMSVYALGQYKGLQTTSVNFCSF